MLSNLRKLLGVPEQKPEQPRGLAAIPAPAPDRLHNPNLVTSSTIGQTLVVTVVDPELNAVKAAEVNHEVRRLMAANAGCRNLVLDLENIEYLDSAGLNTFVDLLAMVKEKQGRIAVAAATQAVEVLFKLTRLELVFTIRRTVLEAVDTIEPKE